MKRALFLVALFLIVGIQVVRAQVMVAPTDNLQSLVIAQPAGTTFVLQPGVHHDSVTSLKNGDTFNGQSGAVENGAKVLTGWTQVTIGGTQYWTTAGGTPVSGSTGSNSNCLAAYPGCSYPQDLYLDNLTYTHVTSLAGITGTGNWYYELQGLTSATVSAAGSGYVVGDVLNVAGGTGGQVTVAALSGTSVAAVTVLAPGLNYPVTPTAETTTGGTGTGCILTVIGGSGAVTNNIYLTNAENPNLHTVELGTLQWLLHSESAQNITIQGLTWEKYAGGIQHGPVSMGSLGGTGAATGWIVQNCEGRLNSKDGIDAGNVANGSMQILNSTFHHNGELGIGGGHLTGGFFTGNVIYSNNTDHVSSGYGAGGIKLANMFNATFSFNTIHNDYGVGLWCDVYCSHVTFDHNTIYNEQGMGIMYEISDFGTITNNIVHDNNQSSSNSGTRAEIEYSNSSHGIICNNLVSISQTHHGISVHYDNTRQCSRPPDNTCTVPVGMSVSGNAFVFAPRTSDQGISLVSANNGSTTSWQVAGIFDYNCHQVPSLPWTNSDWKTGISGVGSAISFVGWQALAQDPNGSLSLTCASPVARGATISGNVKLSGTVNVR